MLAWNLLVIVWGAFVRASGSGAGCGAHWPTCNGDVVPQAPGIKTLIEFTHRAMSGLALVGVVVLAWWAWKAFPRAHRVRKAAAASVVLMLTEALLGAGLVLFQYVAGNVSVGRAIYLSAHMVNTLLLAAAITLAAWWSREESRAPRSGAAGLLGTGWLLGAGLTAAVVIAVTGVIAALGVTLFPASSLAQGMAADIAPAANFLVRLRVLHPVLAACGGIYFAVAALVVALNSGDRVMRKVGFGLVAAVLIQVALGVVNLALLAPVWTQLTHLFVADVVWILLVILSAENAAAVPN
jgi:cytochrome c oxidase assembly protein subunit 15